MKCFLCTVVFVIVCGISFSQHLPQKDIDRLKYELSTTKEYTSRVKILIRLSGAYQAFQKDSCLFYSNRAVEAAREMNDAKTEAHSLIDISIASRIYGDGARSLQNGFEGLAIAEAHGYPLERARALYSLGTMYGDILNENLKAISYFKLAKQIVLQKSEEDALSRGPLVELLDLNLGKFYMEARMTDSSLYYLGNLRSKLVRSDELYPVVEMYWSDLQSRMGNLAAAMEASDNAIQRAASDEIKDRGTAEAYFSRSKLFNTLNKPDSSIYYAQQALALSEKIGYLRVVLLSATSLADQFESKDLKQSIFYLKKISKASDSLYGKKKSQEIQKILADEQERKRIIETKRVATANRFRLYLFSAGLAALLLIAFILYRNNQKEKKAKNLLQEKNHQIEQTLRELKSTQAQLIQSEKMASLGELTAGIAHEIQNPLNFVNNFSEVNNELIEELKIKNEKLKIDDKEVDELLSDIYQNNDRISMYGKRADSIVKGMLQHSRTSSGHKELTDINALCDEYLRLAYHGLRAKDKSFNAKFETDFDDSIGKINIVSQDIGRVILNLINNAFYAVSEKQHGNVKDYEPTVTLSTKHSLSSGEGRGKVLITVTDNGGGIPKNIIDKIFQPFFTTKPTGQGTGLGLSLAYDIVKAHSGEINVETTEGKGSDFVIQLPATSTIP